MARAPKVTFRLSDGFERAVLRSEGVRAMLEPLTEEAAQHARTSAPFRKGFLRGDITAEVLLDTGRDADGRFTAAGGLVGRVTSHDFKTVWEEFGTRYAPAQPFLVPALIATVPGAVITRR